MKISKTDYIIKAKESVMKKGIKFLILLLVVLCWLPVAQADVYECYPYTYDEGKGCSLIKSTGPYYYYASGMLFVGYESPANGIWKGFMRWDLSSVSVPAGYHIGSATYTPHITYAPPGATQNTLGAYRALQPWDVDWVCWNEYDFLLPWNSAGCEAASDAAGDGGAYDRAATPLDEVILMLPGDEDSGTTVAPSLWIGPDDSSASLIELYGAPYNAHTGHMGYYPGNGVMRFIINWDLDTIPDDLEIISANLNLNCSQVVQGSGSHTVEIYRIVGAYEPMLCSWTYKDTTTLWDVAGAVGGSEIDTAPFTTFDWPWGSTTVDVDITDAVKNWKDGTWDSYGVLLKFSDESTSGPYYSVSTNGSSTGEPGAVDVVYENPSLTMDLTVAVQNWVDGAWDNNGVVYIAEDNVNASGFRQMSTGSTNTPHPLIVTVAPDTVTDPPHETCGSLDIKFSSYATDNMEYWIEKKDEMTGTWGTDSDTITTDKDNTSGSLTYVVTGDTTTAPANQDKQFYRVRRADTLQYP